MIKITKRQARRFLLAHQGLWTPQALEGKPGILQFIRRVGCIQFDPLNIVGRNPDLVLQSRIRNYHPAMLSELLYQDRRLLDGIDKVMSIYHVDDWPCFDRRRKDAYRRLGNQNRPVAEVLPEVREAIETQGPLSSIDLLLDAKVDWSWGPTRLARAALESMYFWGELIVHHKVNTRRVYDFSHRHIPVEILEADDPNDTEESYWDWHIHRRIGGVGLLWNRSSEAWLGIRGAQSKERSQTIERLLLQRRVFRVEVEGLEPPFYIRAEEMDLLTTAQEDPRSALRASILAPLDNLLWDRGMVESLFGFRYRWEVYKPEGDREYGYYVLPVLYGDRFVARFEPGRVKQEDVLVIENWWWEPGVEPSKRMQVALKRAFRRFREYLGYGRIQLSGSAAEADIDWLS